MDSILGAFKMVDVWQVVARRGDVSTRVLFYFVGEGGGFFLFWECFLITSTLRARLSAVLVGSYSRGTSFRLVHFDNVFVYSDTLFFLVSL